ncbi:MAG: transglutaminase family protein [Deltaproteobacteria bacterium]|nr:transglutaminase family protein [Deltaproteobacteria bacterium]
MRPIPIFLSFSCFAAALCFGLTLPTSVFSSDTKRFEVVYEAHTEGLPDHGRIARVWIPVPPEDEAQGLLDLKVSSPFPYTMSHEPRWGNRIIYFEAPANGNGFDFKMSFVVERHEITQGKPSLSNIGEVDQQTFSLFLEPSSFAVHDDRVRRYSKTAVGDAVDIMDKARGIYEFTLENMDYAKNNGSGKGDVKSICLAIGGGGKGFGNCTDFHSFFTSLMQVQGIPVMFEMGFPLSMEKQGAVTGGYHCWAKFFVPGRGWFPVDISEADKDQSKKEYFFGSIDADRVLFSRGRDIVLNPPQEAKPLNFFGPDPYMEIDGKPFTGFTRTITYKPVQ